MRTGKGIRTVPRGAGYHSIAMPTSAPRTHLVRAWVAWWVVCAAQWLLLVDNAKPQELAVGAVVAAVAATGAVLVRRERQRLFGVPVRWLPRLSRSVAGLVTDLAPLAVALVRRRREATGLVEVPYAGDGVHRVLTQAFGSLTPNTIVVAVDEERQVLLAHQLMRTADVESRALPLGREP